MRNIIYTTWRPLVDIILGFGRRPDVEALQ
jgi:hypothetical protein